MAVGQNINFVCPDLDFFELVNFYYYGPLFRLHANEVARIKEFQINLRFNPDLLYSQLLVDAYLSESCVHSQGGYMGLCATAAELLAATTFPKNVNILLILVTFI